MTENIFLLYIYWNNKQRVVFNQYTMCLASQTITNKLFLWKIQQ